MTTAELLAQLPDDARVTVTVGAGDLRVADLREAFAGPDPRRLLTTGEAADTFGYSPDSWRRWAPNVPGAYQDEGDGSYWRLPYTGCVDHLARLRAERSRVRRRTRGPWGKGKAASSRAVGSEGVQEGQVLRRRSAAVERRASDDARSSVLRLAR